MAVRTEDDDTESGTASIEAEEQDRYGEISLETGEIVIYDRENHNAWLQSHAAVDLEAKA
jgi:desulfoferrodoxin (superoxide reductase-like protein)